MSKREFEASMRFQAPWPAEPADKPTDEVTKMTEEMVTVDTWMLRLAARNRVAVPLADDLCRVALQGPNLLAPSAWEQKFPEVAKALGADLQDDDEVDL